MLCACPRLLEEKKHVATKSRGVKEKFLPLAKFINTAVRVFKCVFLLSQATEALLLGFCLATRDMLTSGDKKRLADAWKILDEANVIAVFYCALPVTNLEAQILHCNCPAEGRRLEGRQECARVSATTKSKRGEENDIKKQDLYMF